MKNLYLVLLLATIASHWAYGDDATKETAVHSVHLTPDNFDAEIKNRNYLVAFYNSE